MPVGGTAAFGINQHPRITTNYLNQLNRHGDPAPGVPVSTAQVSGSIVQPYGGFEGGKLTITNPWAVQFADPTVGPLYGGVYQYVQLSPTDTAAPVRGQVLFWMDELRYIVTANAATPGGKIAGVSVNETTPGNWDFTQTAGIASVRFSAAGTLGGPVGITAGTTPAFAVTATAVDKNFLGIAVLTAPVANQVSPVELNLAVGFNY